MSMLSHQADELRTQAHRLDSARDFMEAANWFIPESWLRDSMEKCAVEMREAADTIISLRNRLQDAEGARYDAGFENGVRQSPEWAELQSRLAEAERSAAMYKRIAEDQKQRNRDMKNTVNAVTGADAESRWHELFGTPEKAAETLAICCYESTSDACDTCVFADCDGTLRNSAVFQTVSSKMLEWLRGDAE